MIKEVEEDIVEEEEVEVVATIVAAIVESELVEIVLCSDTTKRIEIMLRLKQTRIQNHKKTEIERRVRNKEKRKERVPEFSINACLIDLHYNYLYLYIELTVIA